MPKVVETKVEYRRVIGMDDYGSITWNGSETIQLEEGDVAADVRKAAYEALRAEAKIVLTPIVIEHQRQAKEWADFMAAKGKRKPKPKLPTPTAVPTQGELPSGPELPKTTIEELKPDPTKMGLVRVNEEGRRIRNVEEKSFTVDDVSRALKLLTPEGQDMDNALRSDIRKWLLAGPLNPGFADDNLSLAYSLYTAYRKEGNTTMEAMKKVLALWMQDEKVGKINADAGSSEETDDPATSEPTSENA